MPCFSKCFKEKSSYSLNLEEFKVSLFMNVLLKNFELQKNR